MNTENPIRIPVILTAFGARQNTLEVRFFIENHFKKNFPQCDFHWAFASRSVQKHSDNDTPPSPERLLKQLADLGHDSAILQSLHVVCAAEFHKLIPICQAAPLNVPLGLPLLASLEDCQTAALAMDAVAHLPEDMAVVLALHGSSHPGGAFFHLLGKLFMETWGERAFYGMIEGQPDRIKTAKKIRAAGFSRAAILPFTLVTGQHFEKDLMGEKNSWYSAFLEEGIAPAIHPQGIGLRPKIVDIFCRHLRKALETLPSRPSASA